MSRSAFSHCDGLREISFADDLEDIGDYAFYTCPNLTDVKFPARLQWIGYRAFDDCPIKNIRYSTRAEQILKNYFGYKWHSLEKIVLD
ncbi:MAG: leucine-rich repeat domain-containing protein [Selenomonadaceae bacterium]|nr:leucine-rich repeat domain-containing protein [Selenomonadaceae bacterium]